MNSNEKKKLNDYVKAMNDYHYAHHNLLNTLESKALFYYPYQNDELEFWKELDLAYSKYKEVCFNYIPFLKTKNKESEEISNDK